MKRDLLERFIIHKPNCLYNLNNPYHKTFIDMLYKDIMIREEPYANSSALK